MLKLFKVGNYSRAETICGNTVDSVYVKINILYLFFVPWLRDKQQCKGNQRPDNGDAAKYLKLP